MARNRRERLRLLLTIALYQRRRQKRRRQRAVWARKIFQRRKRQGVFHNLIQEMRLQDQESHFRYFRMSKETFDHLLSLVGPQLARRQYWCSRPSISPAERLAVTLRYLATGNSQVSLSFNFRIGRSTLCGIVRETSEVLWDALHSKYVPAPSTQEEWRVVSRQFEQLWNFPHCIGAIDGKHIVIQAPANGGSLYYNYKGMHSVVLMAVVDAMYRFILIDIGDSGKHSDGGVFGNCLFGQALEDGDLHIPDDSPLPGTNGPALPFVMVGDEAFPLRKYMMRPYAGRNLDEQKAIFNYRLSRARRIVENAFGILAARWRLYRRPIIAKPDNVVKFTKATIALHNFLRTEESAVYCPAGFVDGEDGSGNIIQGTWRDGENASGLVRTGKVSSNRYSQTAADVREQFTNYFCTSAGEVSWQYTYVRRT